MIPKMAASIAGAGHVVSSVRDDKAVVSALAGEAFQMLVVSLRGADATVIGVLEAVRKSIASKSVCVMIIAEESAEDLLIRLYDAGADLCLQAPTGIGLLLAQLRSVERALVGGAAAGQAKADTPLELVNQWATWRLAQTKIQEVAARFLSMEVAVGEAESITQPLGKACAIALSNAEHQLELRVAVAAEGPCGQQLAIHMFGPECADLVSDVLSELANVVMGMLKNEFSAESIAFTGGLPTSLDPAHVMRPLARYSHNRAFALRIGQGGLLVHLSIRSKANQLLAPHGLSEGMVLAKDVFNARGMLMVRGGTRLTMNMIEKIVGVAPPKLQLEVIVP